jgi:hypothetical protein
MKFKHHTEPGLSRTLILLTSLQGFRKRLGAIR